MTIRTT